MAWLALLVTTLWKLTRARRRNPYLEAGCRRLLIVAVNLGEVLFELPAMVLIGLALAYLSTDTAQASESTPIADSSPVSAPSALVQGSP